MKPSLLVLALTTAGFLLGGCEDAPPTALAPSSGDNPSFTFVNNPDNGNPRIMRFEEGSGFFILDPTTDLFSLQAAKDLRFGCNTSPTLFTWLDVQHVHHDPDNPLAGQINEVLLGRGVYIAVFEDYTGWAASGWTCSALSSRMLAEGSGNLTLTDNDLYAFLRPNTNHNAFGFVAQGKVERVGGGMAHYNGVTRCVWDSEDLASMKCNDRINFR